MVPERNEGALSVSAIRLAAMLTHVKRSTAAILVGGALLAGCQKNVPRSQLPHLGTFCVQKEKWDDLLITMKRFAVAQGLEFHGGIETGPNRKPLFNAYVARGYSYWFGDDLDLWIVSSPFKEGEMNYNGISKRPWSQQDTEMARALLYATEPLQCHVSGDGS
jgi:hypothetical protein